MYEKAVVTNERLKSRLETSKQDLAVIQEQLQTAQVQTAGILFWFKQNVRKDKFLFV